MTDGVGKKPKMRRKRAPLGEASRDGDGNVTMIRFSTYKDNPFAPTALVCKIGGIFRVNAHLIRVTFVDEVPNSEGVLEAIATGHLVWKTQQDLDVAREAFEWAMGELKAGHLGDGGRPQ